MIRNRCIYLSVISILANGLLSIALAQEIIPNRGIMPNDDVLSNPIDNIEASTGRLFMSIPLASLPPIRGGSGFELTLKYNSNLYNIDTTETQLYCSPQPDPPLTEFVPSLTPPSWDTAGGWTYNIDNIDIIAYVKPNVDENLNDFPPTYPPLRCSSHDARYHKLTVRLWDGSQHTFHLKGYEEEHYDSPEYTGDGFFGFDVGGASNACSQFWGWPAQVPGPLTYYTTDGSFLKLIYEGDQRTLFFPDGTRIVWSPTGTYIYDKNDNIIEIHKHCDDADCDVLHTSISDASGREINIYKSSDWSSQEWVDGWVRDRVEVEGAKNKIKYNIDWQGVPLSDPPPNYRYYGQISNCSWFLPLLGPHASIRYIHEYTDDADVVTLGTTPPPEKRHQFYEFGYSDISDLGFGELDFMKLPSGAEYHYHYFYENGDNYPIEGILSAENIALENRITQKTIIDNSVSPATNLSWSFQYDSQWTNITNPDGGHTIHYFGPIFNYIGGKQVEQIVEEPNGSKRSFQYAQNKAYGTRGPFITETPNNSYIYRETHTIRDSSGLDSKTAFTEFVYDKNGNLRQKKEYDWVDYPEPNGETILRQTDIEYINQTVNASVNIDDSNAYWQTNAPPRLTQVLKQKISNGSDVFAATKFVYDNRGNVLFAKHWDNEKQWNRTGLRAFPSSGDWPDLDSQISARRYDSYGNLEYIDGPEVPTRFVYDNQTNSYLMRIEKAYGTNAQRTESYLWTPNGAAIQSKTDQENDITVSYDFDNYGRKNEITEGLTPSAPDGIRQTLKAYDQPNRKITETSDLRTLGDGDLQKTLQTIMHYDGLGRVVLAQKSDGAPMYGDEDGIKLRTQYFNPAGSPRWTIASTPYRSQNDPTLEWTCTQYDQLDRVIAVGMFKGSVPPLSCTSQSNRTGFKVMEYDGEWTKIREVANDPAVADPNDKIRWQRRDALGRLVEVVEDPNYTGNPGGLNYSTMYSYDPLDNLMQVVQGAQTRTFHYSSLSRLIDATNPESGTVSYTYDDGGNLLTRTDARGITSTMTYDVLHRIKTKTYDDGTPQVVYDYYIDPEEDAPNVGQLRQVLSGIAKTEFAYNELGNVVQSTQTITDHPEGPQIFEYDWFLNGQLKRIQYPSGREVNYQVDNAGRTNMVSSANTTYANLTTAGNYSFTPDGKIAEMSLGNNALWETRQYFPPGYNAPTIFKLGSSRGSGDKIQLKYHFWDTVNNANIARNLGTQEIIRPGGSWTQHYEYDELNRLKRAYEEGAGGFDRIYGYDRFGNRWIDASSNNPVHEVATEPTSINDYSSTTNRLLRTGTGYDTAGNQTTFGQFTLEYDAENRIKKILNNGNAIADYTYDGDGRRVRKITYSGGTGSTTYYTHNALGQLASEYSAETPTDIGTSYIFTDMLGSVRAVVSNSGAEECYDYLPFGRALSSADNGRSACHQPNPDVAIDSSLPQKFTGKERDAETGLDYFGARYYSGAQGRFVSSDPLKMSNSKIENPQSWNGYVYVSNNPLRYTDPDGLYQFADCNGSEEECLYWQKVFNTSISNAKKELNSGKLTDAEARDLAETLAYLGEPGKGDVRIVFADLGGDWGRQVEINGIKGIKIDMGAIIGASEESYYGFKFNLAAEVGGTAVHESRHGKNKHYPYIVRNGFLEQDLAAIAPTESAAYFSQSLVFKALGASSVNGLWMTRWQEEGLSEAQLNELRNIGIQNSVTNTIDHLRREKRAQGYK